MARYEHTTRIDFKTQFFNRVGDTSRSFWTDAEADIILNEALYTLGAIGQNWKGQVELNTVLDQSFYDINSNLTAGTQSLISYSLTYQFLLDAINLHLIEEITLLAPSSEITSLDEILKFARNRVNQFQFKTGLVLTREQYTLNVPPDNKLIIKDEVIDIVRAAYVDFNELTNPFLSYVLNKEDEDSIGQFNRSYFNSTTDIPLFYTTVLENLNVVRVYPSPQNLGALDIVSVNGIPTATVLALNTIINLPNNLIPYIKWGVLADIYWKDGVGYNPAMANYCEERWREGIIIGNNYTSILEAKLNGIPILIDSVSSLDKNQLGWQNNINTPSLVAVAGFNLLAINCRPDDFYSLLITAIINANIDANFVDVKLEYIEPLLNYCVHLANVKNGFEAVKMTSVEKDDFIKTAISHNLRLMKRGINFETMMKKTKRQEEDNSTRVEEAA
jgi:hypothetical protein